MTKSSKSKRSETKIKAHFAEGFCNHVLMSAICTDERTSLNGGMVRFPFMTVDQKTASVIMRPCSKGPTLRTSLLAF
jgi:hypothetical protein